MREERGGEVSGERYRGGGVARKKGGKCEWGKREGKEFE